MRLKILPLLAVVCLLAACTNNQQSGFNFYESYYPLTPETADQKLIYQLDSFIYSETSPIDTVSWQLREQITDQFMDLEGETAWVIERHIRATAADEWEYHSTWSVKRTENGLERVEENLRFLRLVFPPADGQSWNGHAYLGPLDDIPVTEQCNNLSFLDGWEYSYANVHQPYTLDSLSFDSTVTVVQIGENNLIEYNNATEVFAMDVGLIYRSFDHLTTQQICATCPWEDKVECGYSVRLKLLSIE